MMDRLLDKFPLPRSAFRWLDRLRLRVEADQCTSFQYSFFSSHASQVNTSRNSTTQIPRA
jgi:hypothetical protein